MFPVGTCSRWLATAGVVALLAGCTGGSPDPAPTNTEPRIDIAAARGALLEAKDIGPTWTTPQRSAATPTMVALCGGDAAAPPVPGKPTLATASLVDEGEGGAQSLDQVALVYDNAAAATAGLQELRAAATGCRPTVTKAPELVENRRLVGFTETVRTSPLNPQGWSGFVVVRHRAYDDAIRPTIGDTAVAVLTTRNTVVVVAYAIYRLNAASTGPQFTADWQRLVRTVVSRLS